MDVYVVVSHTGTGVGKIIRKLSHQYYNHVALALEPDLRKLYSFARRRIDCALYGGFVVETPLRYLDGGEVPVRVYRVPVSDEDYARICARLREMLRRPGHYIYNMFALPALMFGAQLPVRDSYTCLSFAASLLKLQAMSIPQLEERIGGELIYEGPLSALTPGWKDETRSEYFVPMGRIAGAKAAAYQLAQLTARMLHMPARL